MAYFASINQLIKKTANKISIYSSKLICTQPSIVKCTQYEKIILKNCNKSFSNGNINLYDQSRHFHNLVNNVYNHSTTLVQLPTNQHFKMHELAVSNLKLFGTIWLIFVRYKFKGKGKNIDTKIEEEGEESVEYDIPFDGAPRDYIDVKALITSFRLDVVMKFGLNINRSKVEEAFYESRIRVNGKKVFKKSQEVSLNDELDLVKGRCEENPEFLNIMRVQIVHIREERTVSDRIEVILRRWRNLVVENYADKWEGII